MILKRRVNGHLVHETIKSEETSGFMGDKTMALGSIESDTFKVNNLK